MKKRSVLAYLVFSLISISIAAQTPCVWSTDQTGKIVETCGSIGVGTTTPADRMSIFGGTSNINVGGNFGGGYNAVWLNGGTGTNNYNLLSSAADPTLYINGLGSLQFRIGNAQKMILDGSGNLGLGTISPLGRFHVQGVTHLPGTGAWGTAQLLSSDAIAADKGGVLNLGGIYNSTGAFADWAGVAGLKSNAVDGDYGGYLVLYTRTNGAGTAERMRIDSNGNTGIGVTAPTERLHIGGNILATGDISANGTINAKYQDVAEWVASSMALDPATVVVLDRSHEDQVLPSTSAYDAAVAGVVSPNPGLVLGVRAAGKEKIATSGRVKVRVDADLGAIAIGDLLVTSDVAGTAMKSQPIEIGGRKFHQPGTVIGKALQPLASGRGEILVLLSLQ